MSYNWGMPRARLSDEDRAIARKAHREVAKAVARGDLVRPEKCACGTVGGIKGHHADYSKPLEVEWVCELCHRQRHGGLQVAPSGTVTWSIRVPVDLAEKIDEASGGNRSAFLRWVVERGCGLTDEPWVPTAEYGRMSPKRQKRVEPGVERPAKVVRLEVARAVKSSAEAKAGLRPLNDWRNGDDAA